MPKSTPRIITTNWAWEAFWPREAFQSEHLGPIKRRARWVEIKHDLRVFPGAGTELTPEQLALIDRNRQEALARRASRGEHGAPESDIAQAEVALAEDLCPADEPASVDEEDPFELGGQLD